MDRFEWPSEKGLQHVVVGVNHWSPVQSMASSEAERLEPSNKQIQDAIKMAWKPS